MNLLKNKSDHTSNDKVQLFCGDFVVIEGELFADVNLTDGTTFLAAPKRRIRKITIKNGWNTQIFQILREKCDGKFIFKRNFLIILPNYVELSHEWFLTNFKYGLWLGLGFNCLMSQNKDIFSIYRTYKEIWKIIS